MKTYERLSVEEQGKARGKALTTLLERVCDGSLRFNDRENGDDLQARIDTAIEKAEKMRTPWFAYEYVMDTCRTELDGMALCDAEDTLYAEPDENVLHGIVTE